MDPFHLIKILSNDLITDYDRTTLSKPWDQFLDTRNGKVRIACDNYCQIALSSKITHSTSSSFLSLQITRNSVVVQCALEISQHLHSQRLQFKTEAIT